MHGKYKSKGANLPHAVHMPKSPTVAERYCAENNNPDNNLQPRQRHNKEAYEMKKIVYGNAQNAAIITDKNCKIDELEKALISQEREHEVRLEARLSDLNIVQQQQIDKMSQNELVILSLKRELAKLRGEEEESLKKTEIEEEEDEAELECWERIDDRNAVRGEGDIRQGQITYKYDPEYKKPTPRSKVIEKAMAEAEELKEFGFRGGCIGFSVNMNIGVEFYSKDCYAKTATSLLEQVEDAVEGEVSGELAEDPGWTFYKKRAAKGVIEKAEEEIAKLSEDGVDLFTE